MISDILSDLTIDLDDYLTNSLHDDTYTTYTGDIRERILKFRDEANQILSELDAGRVRCPKCNLSKTIN